MADDRVEIEIILDDGSIQRGFANVKKQADDTGKSILGSFTKLGPAIAAVGATIAAAFAGKKIIEAAVGQENAIQQLNTSLKLAGTFSQEASLDIQNFASELQKTTRFGDETILSQVALARNFARTNEEAKKLVSAAVDLSEATGISLDSSVKNLGKTFSGLTGELGESVPALRNLTKEQLQAGGALDLVASRFGGAASQSVQTFSGRIEQLQNIFGDLLEEIGFIITQSPGLSAAFGFVADALSGIVDSFKGLRGSSKDILGEALVGLATFAEGVTTFVIAPIEFVANAINTAFNGIRLAIQGLITGYADVLSRVANFFAPDSEFAKALNTFKESSGEVFDEFSKKSNESVDNIFNFEASTKIFDFVEGFKNTVQSAIDKTGQLSTEGGNNVKNFADTVGKEAKKAEFNISQGIGAGISKTVQDVTNALRSGQNAFSAFAKSILGVFGDLAIQLGQFFIIQGIAVDALKAISGAGAIAAGIALVALGTLLKGAAGGGGGLTTPSGAAAGDAGLIGGGGLVTDVDEADEVEQRDQTKVALNIQGDVLDSRETGLRIVEILNESFDSRGTVLV